MHIRFSYFARGTPCPSSLAPALFLTFLCRIFRCRGPKKYINNLQQPTSHLCAHTRSPCVSPDKRKSTVQNESRRILLSILNPISYGAWKFFSPYGSCSACTIRNRFSIFSFQSVSAFSAFDNMIIKHNLPKKQGLYFPLRTQVRLFGHATYLPCTKAKEIVSAASDPPFGA